MVDDRKLVVLVAEHVMGKTDRELENDLLDGWDPLTNAADNEAVLEKMSEDGYYYLVRAMPKEKGGLVEVRFFKEPGFQATVGPLEIDRKRAIVLTALRAKGVSVTLGEP